jgi:hypothetical protein
MFRTLLTAIVAAATMTAVEAQSADKGFVTGPVIEDFGPAAPVDADMALSAMTAHAVLSAEGYSLNPF